jgi:hypothetical protein
MGLQVDAPQKMELYRAFFAILSDGHGVPQKLTTLRVSPDELVRLKGLNTGSLTP